MMSSVGSKSEGHAIPNRVHCGFTLLELIVTGAIIAIIVGLTIPAISKLRAKAQAAQCMANLKTIYLGAELYLQQNGSWPQIGTDDEDDFGNGWIAALKPFGVPEKSWICPTNQNQLGNPDISDPNNIRVDYVATPFDDKPTTPHLWPTQPWFAESGNVHGHGNLIIFTDGSINDLNTAVKNLAGK
jgi:prepilin-type N-terminal cleavage/methylation domain-containing protein